jgi:serine/threonine protein kinase
MTAPGPVKVEPWAFRRARDRVQLRAQRFVDAGADAGGEVLERKSPRGVSMSELTLNPADRVPVDGPPIRGAFAVVRKARHRVTGEISALKEITMSGDTDFYREAEILSALWHPVIVGIIGFVFPHTNEAGVNIGTIVTEWLPRGALSSYIESPTEYAKLTPTIKAKIIVGIAKGMAYLHASNIWHRDLKPSNILLDENFEVRIADFGTARLMDMQLTVTDDFETPFYIAPDANPTGLTDVWAYGMMVWELLTGRPLTVEFAGKFRTAMDLLKKLSTGLRPKLDGLSDVAQALLEDCWVLEAKDGTNTRITFPQIVERLKRWNYALIDGVRGNEMEAYVEAIDAFEREYPPMYISAGGDE